MPAAQSGRHKLRNDIILISALLLVVSVIGACIFFIRGDGDCVEVRVDGELYGRYPLDRELRLEIHSGADGQQLNVLVIKDGEAHVESATCPDGICSEHRAVKREGESIVCLPHKVVITVCTVGDDAPDVIV